MSTIAKRIRHYHHPSDIHHKGKQVGRHYRTRSAASQYIPSSGYPEIGTGIQITAWAPDSIAEAIEAYPIRQMIGVQFHPEIFTAAGDTTMHKLFKFLVNKADTFNLAKDIHSRILSIDTHTDTPLWFKTVTV